MGQKKNLVMLLGWTRMLLEGSKISLRWPRMSLKWYIMSSNEHFNFGDLKCEFDQKLTRNSQTVYFG